MEKHIIATRLYYDDKKMYDDRVELMKRTLIPSLKQQQTDFIFAILGDNFIDTLELDIPFVHFHTLTEMTEYCLKENITIQTRHDSDDMMVPEFTAYIQNVAMDYKCSEDLLLVFNAQYYHIEKEQLMDRYTKYTGAACSMFLTMINRKKDKNIYKRPHTFMGEYIKNKVIIAAGYVLYGWHDAQIMKVPIEKRKKLRQSAKGEKI